VPPENTVAVVLQLAQCQQNAGHPEQAESSYELAQKISAQVGQKKLQSLASVGEAALESQQKKIPQALRLYQSAITLDRESGDRASEASDWYSYGIFLRDAGLPPRLAYACLVESESLTRSLENATEIKDAALAREELEGKIANEASAIRRDPQPALEQALSFSVSSGAKNQ
jgi:tetratricopeptide (TPR) repeat protein